VERTCGRDPGRSAMRRECEQWIREALANGPIPAKEVIRLGGEGGYRPDQVKRAKQGIGAQSKREGFGPESSVSWCLADASEPSPGPYSAHRAHREQTR
jgi:hypothetical protein